MQSTLCMKRLLLMENIMRGWASLPDDTKATRFSRTEEKNPRKEKWPKHSEEENRWCHNDGL
eukprot:scaffold100419_cov32-Tisochrysis_lutea.AAC.4